MKTTFSLDPGFSIQKPWDSAVHFLTTDSPFPYGYDFNILEKIGFFALEGLRSSVRFWNAETLLPNSHPLLMKTLFVALAIITSPLSALGVILRIVGGLCPHIFKEHYDTELRSTPRVVINQLYYIHKHFHACAKKHKLPYVLASGSALGERREKKIIHFDDDMDVFIKKDHENKLLSMNND